MSAAIAPGEVFAGYRIEAVVDRGGMGVVYRATDLRLERPVALKLVAPELAGNEQFRSRFLKEPRLAAALDHPNVVPIYEAGEHDGRLFLAMRFVPGSNLKTRLERDGVLEPARALAILAQIADALDAAHRRGLVHRDVKPANVLLDDEGHAYLSDFGITKQVGSESTQTGEIVGTLDYLAPEQIRGEPVDGRTDEYALGCVLYECLAGTAPFRRDTQMATMWAHLQEPQPPLASHPQLDPVVAKALAKEREDRYATCSELIGAAQAVLTPAAPTAPMTVAMRRLIPRRRAILAAGLAVLAASVAAAVIALSSGDEAQAVPVESGVAAFDGKGEVAAFVDTTTVPSNVAVGEGGVWLLTTQDRTVSRIDPRTEKLVSTFEMQGIPSDIAAGAGSVWVGTVGGDRANVNTTGRISKVDPATGKVVRTIRLPGRGSGWASVGYPGIAVGDGAVWAKNPRGTISRIDPQSARVTGEVKADAGNIAAGKEGVWFVNGNSVTRINTRTNRPGQTIQSGSNQLMGIAVGAGSVWATAGAAEGLVWRFEPGPHPIAQSIPVGAGSGFIAFGAGAVWVANYTDGTVSRIDPRTNRVTSRRPIGPVQALAAGDLAAWVTVAGAPGAGTLPPSACSPVEAGGATPDVIVASDLPLQGPQSSYPRSLLEAIRQVFRERSYRAGRFRVGLQSCDASTAQSGVWEPRRCSANAQAYGRAKRLVAVIGPYNSDCAKFQLPILNRAPGGAVPMVSPANTDSGLTREGLPPPDGYRDEPDVFYPSGTRNYFRVIGTEALQGVALGMTADGLGLDRVYVLQDGADNSWDRAWLIDPFLRTARRLRVRIAGRERYDGAARSFDTLAARIDRSGADGVVIAGDIYSGGDRLLKALRARLGHRLPILAGFMFEFPHEIRQYAGSAAEGVYLSTTDIPGRTHELTPAARDLARGLGIPPSEPIGPMVLEAGQATDVVLDAIGRSNGTRASVLKQLRATNVRNGILGSFRFDRYGDITPAGIPVLRITRSRDSQRLGEEDAVLYRMVSVPASLSG